MNLTLLPSLGLALALGPTTLAADEVGKGDAKKTHLVTFDLEDWGGGPDAKENAHKVLKKQFDEAFPRGLRIGKDKKGLHSFRLDSAEEVRKLLPVRGEPGVMTESSKAGLKAAGGLAGQLIAAKLNVGFDSIGAIGATKANGETPLAQRVLKRKVAKKLKGLTVLELIQASDKAISGKFGEKVKPSDKVVDLDGDDKPDTTLRALREALNLVNNSHQKGDMMKVVLADPGLGETADEEEDEELGEEEDGGLSPAQETAMEKLESRRDRQLEELEESLRSDHERAVEAGDREKANELRERYRAKRQEIDRKFEQDKERLEAQWRQRRAAKQEAEKAGPPGLEKKGPLKKDGVRGRAKGHDPDHPSRAGKGKGKGDGDDG
ncbi:MAG: hypothetical protein ACF8XB_03765 [Planctomycetota bacterium JB042]